MYEPMGTSAHPAAVFLSRITSRYFVFCTRVHDVKANAKQSRKTAFNYSTSRDVYFSYNYTKLVFNFDVH